MESGWEGTKKVERHDNILLFVIVSEYVNKMWSRPRPGSSTRIRSIKGVKGGKGNKGRQARAVFDVLPPRRAQKNEANRQDHAGGDDGNAALSTKCAG